MSEPEITIENEKRLSQHWFSNIFYKKDGRKERVNPKWFKWSCGFIFLLGYAGFIFQENPIKSQAADSLFTLGKDFILSKVTQIPLFRSEPKKQVARAKKGTETQKARLFLGPELITRPKIPIPPGLMVRAKLSSGASNGSVRAEILESLVVNGETLFDSRPVILGNGSSTEDRLFIRFNQMVFRDGTVQTIEAQAYDLDDKTTGLKGSLLGNRALKVIGSIGLNFVGGVSEGLQETDVKNGAAFHPSTLKNALLNGSSRTAIEESREMMSGLRNSEPRIHIDSGKEFLLSFEGN